MKIVITGHAEEQIRFRKLSHEQVMEVAAHPQQVVVATRNRSFAQNRYVQGGKEYLLRVLFEDVEDERRIITLYPTSKVRKYWRGTE